MYANRFRLEHTRRGNGPIAVCVKEYGLTDVERANRVATIVERARLRSG